MTEAPILPATILSEGCYKGIFEGCSNLRSVTMLATDIGETCLTNWLVGVAASGTFTKAAGMTTLPQGGSGIPTGWTVQDYSNNN